MERYEDEDRPRLCENCALCVHTYLGGECSLTDKPIEYTQLGCNNFLAII